MWASLRTHNNYYDKHCVLPVRKAIDSALREVQLWWLLRKKKKSEVFYQHDGAYIPPGPHDHHTNDDFFNSPLFYIAIAGAILAIIAIFVLACVCRMRTVPFSRVVLKIYTFSVNSIAPRHLRKYISRRVSILQTEGKSPGWAHSTIVLHAVCRV